jgi:alcohol dehydrogenase class IV
MRFDFGTAGRILFGEGTVAELPGIAKGFGDRVMLVTGARPERYDAVVSSLRETGLHVSTFSVPGEPTTQVIEVGVDVVRSTRSEVVVALGGGSVLDAAKAIAIMAAHERPLLDFLEVIGGGATLTRPGLPCITVPTTSGTGAEVTRNAVLQSVEHRVKVSLRSSLMMPRVALVDPELTHSAPPNLTAATGMDALTQLIEAYVSARANPFTDALCVEGIRRAARSLARAYRDGSDRAARADMAVASLFSGIALANAGLGAVHGIAGPMGGRSGIPHGTICAMLLPRVMKVNLRALRERDPKNPAIERYRHIAEIVLGVEADREGACASRPSAEEGIEWVHALQRTLAIPELRSFNISKEDLDLILEGAQRASSMKANPIVLEEKELTEIVAC